MPGTRISTMKGRKQSRDVSYRTGVKPPQSMESRMFPSKPKTTSTQKMGSKWSSGCKNCGH